MNVKAKSEQTLDGSMNNETTNELGAAAAFFAGLAVADEARAAVDEMLRMPGLQLDARHLASLRKVVEYHREEMLNGLDCALESACDSVGLNYREAKGQ